MEYLDECFLASQRPLGEEQGVEDADFEVVAAVFEFDHGGRGSEGWW